MTVGSQEWSKYPFLIKSNRPGTKRGRSTAGRPTTILSLGISDHYKPKGRFFCDSKERCQYDLIEAFAAWQPPDRLRPAPILYRWERIEGFAARVLEYQLYPTLTTSQCERSKRPVRVRGER